MSRIAATLAVRQAYKVGRMYASKLWGDLLMGLIEV